jgi:hypothetical protein
MAVFKASYTKSRGAAKAYIRYITHRPGINGERTTRELFGADGGLTKLQAYRVIDEGRRGTVFYRLVVSPDPKQEDGQKDLDLREITEQTMMQLQDRLAGKIFSFWRPFMPITRPSGMCISWRLFRDGSRKRTCKRFAPPRLSPPYPSGQTAIATWPRRASITVTGGLPGRQAAVEEPPRRTPPAPSSLSDGGQPVPIAGPEARWTGAAASLSVRTAVSPCVDPSARGLRS